MPRDATSRETTSPGGQTQPAHQAHHPGGGQGVKGDSGTLKLAQAFELCQRIRDRVPYEMAGVAATQQKAFAWCEPTTAGNLNGPWTIYVLEMLPDTGVPSDVYPYATRLATVDEAERFIATPPTGRGAGVQGLQGVRQPLAGQTSQGPGHSHADDRTISPGG